MQITISGLNSLKTGLDKELSDFVKRVSVETEIDARKNTPIKTGNARRKWTRTNTKDNFVVQNKVPYIERLEAGASRQAPKGIIGPTLTQVKGKFI
jgi:hypothetical protein